MKDLKGKAYETLGWQTEEGFVAEPFYTAEDTAKIPLETVQAAQQTTHFRQWQNREVIPFTDEKTSRVAALSALNKGADALVFDLSHTNAAHIDFIRLLDAIKLTDTPVFFRTNRQSTEVVEALQKLTAYHVKGGLEDDWLAHWMQDGQWHADTWPNLADLLRRTQAWPHFRPITISGPVFHNAGANAAQELAFTLASAVTYLDKLTDEGLVAGQVIGKMAFSVSLGTSYFMEIAKLRALRYLFQRIGESYGSTDRFPMPIHAQTSTFYDAAVEPYTNLLRGTTEAMAAIIGGCDSLIVHPYDAVTGQTDEFSQRIARNVSTILKEEAYLNKVIDPAAGSYYLENLTFQLSQQAWALFLEVERRGGLMAAFEQGFVQNEIERTYERKAQQLEAGERVLVGVNKYRTGPSTDAASLASEPLTGKGKLLINRRLAARTESSLTHL